MKKILTILIAVGLAFASTNNDEINKKLDLLLNKLDTLEKKLDEKDVEIKKLKQALQQQQKEIKKQEVKTKTQLALKNCDNLKVTNFEYKYHDDVLPYVTFKVTITNNYPYEITHISGNVYFDDKNDGTTFIKHYINRKVDIKPGESVTITGEHTALDEIEKMIKNENPSDLNVYFSPNAVDFQGAPTLKCY